MFEQNKRLVKIVIVFLVLIIINNILKSGISGFVKQLFVLLAVAPAAIIAIVGHELSHAYVSHLLGDPLPKALDRLTLNPLKHLDPLGTVMIFIAHIGWAKPVMIDPRYYKNRKIGEFLVAIAGPGMNFILAFFSAIIFGIVLKSFPDVPDSIGLPLYIFSFLQYLFMLNTALGVFNLIPIPPLDGSKILYTILPDEVVGILSKLEPIMMIVLIILVISGAFQSFFFPLVLKAQNIIISIASFLI